jgi:hypothetical protein
MNTVKITIEREGETWTMEAEPSGKYGEVLVTWRGHANSEIRTDRTKLPNVMREIEKQITKGLQNIGAL